MTSIESLLSKLHEVGSDAQENGTGWQARCPAHDDHKASLSISSADDGKVLIRCHAGCATESIVAKLGLTMADLFPPPPQGQQSTVYSYRDAEGNVAFEKVRYEPKRFVQRRPDGNGGHVHSLKSGWFRPGSRGWQLVAGANDPASSPAADARWFDAVPHVLYRLPEIMEAVQAGRTILYVEGEKDADNLVHIGLEATTNSGGAGEVWREEYGAALRGARVVFIPDQDKAGAELFERYAPQIAKVAQKLRKLDLPDGFKDISDWLAAGHTRAELDALIAAAPVWTAQGPSAEILDAAPEAIRRPLSLVGGRGYSVAWVPVQQGDTNMISKVVVRDDGQLFAAAPLPGALPFDQLDPDLDLPHIPPQDRLWSGAGVKRYIGGERPNPAQTFGRVRRIVDHYMDFGRSLGPQELMVDLVALYTVATYFLDAFCVVGYLWANGDKGAGKTKNLTVIVDMAYLGMLVLAGGTYASLRDLADYGACLGFDDAEKIMDPRLADPDKRTLLLAGNRRSAYVTVKELRGKEWFVRYIHAYCPRLFSGIQLPDDVLASRTIMVPLVRSADGAKANRDPADHEAWPVDRRRLVDDLWALGLSHLSKLRAYDRLVVGKVSLTGRNLEPWRAILAVALWLQEEGHVPGLFDRINDLAVRYQTERVDLEEASPVRILIHGLQAMIGILPLLVFTPTDLASAMNRLAVEMEVEHPGDTFTNAKRAGLLLRRLRFSRAGRSADRKRWQITRTELDSLARAYAMPTLPTLPAEHIPTTDGTPACHDAECAVDAEAAGGRATPGREGEPGAECHDAECAVDAVLRETPLTAQHSAATTPDLGFGTTVVTTDAKPDIRACNDLKWNEEVRHEG